MNTMNDKLATLIANELERQGWSARELGRRSGYTGAYISRIIAGEQKGTFDFCAAIAPHLGKTPEELFRLVGLLPTEPEPGQNEDKLLAGFRQLSPQQQQFLIDSMRGLQGRLPEPPAIRESLQPYEPSPIPAVPDDEDIMDLFKHLDPYHQGIVYNFARYQFTEQQNSSNSSGVRQRAKELDETINLIDLLLNDHAANPRKRELIITYLVNLFATRWGGEIPEGLKRLLPSETSH